MAEGGAAADDVDKLLATCQAKLLPGEYAVVARAKHVLVDKELVSPDIVGVMTYEQLVGISLTPGAAAALKKAFPSTGALGPTGCGVRLLRLLLRLCSKGSHRTYRFGLLGSFVRHAAPGKRLSDLLQLMFYVLWANLHMQAHCSQVCIDVDTGCVRQEGRQHMAD
jgi:hypothetical protein